MTRTEISKLSPDERKQLCISLGISPLSGDRYIQIMTGGAYEPSYEMLNPPKHSPEIQERLDRIEARRLARERGELPLINYELREAA